MKSNSDILKNLDVSFLSAEEQVAIQQVLFRNSELQQHEDGRIKKLKKSVPDPRQLWIMTGEWFDEMKAKRYRQCPSAIQILKSAFQKTTSATADKENIKPTNEKTRRTNQIPAITEEVIPVTKTTVRQSKRNLEADEVEPAKESKGKLEDALEALAAAMVKELHAEAFGIKASPQVVPNHSANPLPSEKETPTSVVSEHNEDTPFVKRNSQEVRDDIHALNRFSQVINSQEQHDRMNPSEYNSVLEEHPTGKEDTPGPMKGEYKLSVSDEIVRQANSSFVFEPFKKDSFSGKDDGPGKGERKVSIFNEAAEVASSPSVLEHFQESFPGKEDTAANEKYNVSLSEETAEVAHSPAVLEAFHKESLSGEENAPIQGKHKATSFEFVEDIHSPPLLAHFQTEPLSENETSSVKESYKSAVSEEFVQDEKSSTSFDPVLQEPFTGDEVKPNVFEFNQTATAELPQTTSAKLIRTEDLNFTDRVQLHKLDADKVLSVEENKQMVGWNKSASSDKQSELFVTAATESSNIFQESKDLQGSTSQYQWSYKPYLIKSSPLSSESHELPSGNTNSTLEQTTLLSVDSVPHTEDKGYEYSSAVAEVLEEEKLPSDLQQNVKDDNQTDCTSPTNNKSFTVVSPRYTYMQSMVFSNVTPTTINESVHSHSSSIGNNYEDASKQTDSHLKPSREGHMQGSENLVTAMSLDLSLKSTEKLPSEDLGSIMKTLNDTKQDNSLQESTVIQSGLKAETVIDSSPSNSNIQVVQKDEDKNKTSEAYGSNVPWKSGTEVPLRAHSIQIEVSDAEEVKVSLENSKKHSLGSDEQSEEQDQEKQHVSQNISSGSPAVLEVRNATSIPTYLEVETDFDDLTSESSYGSDFSGHSRGLTAGRLSAGGMSGSSLSLYSEAGDFGSVAVQGAVEFALKYDEVKKEFTILVEQCLDLAVVNLKRGRTDPYVKTYLLPDRSRASKKKTSIKKNTVNPIYRELLKYSIDKRDLQTRTLNASVWHNDTLGRNVFLGEVELELRYWDWRNDQLCCYNLKPKIGGPEEPSSSTGQINLAVKFIPAGSIGVNKPVTGELHIWLKEARGLQSQNPSGVNSFIKCHVLPDTSKTSRQKTRVIKKSFNPIYNHTMVYDGFRSSEIRETCVELTIWDHETFSNHFLGGVRLSLGTGKSYGKSVNWMDSTEAEITVWKTMLAKPNIWAEVVLPLRPTMSELK
ncbi:synaptotagmin-like protein 2 isoform X2 [Protopterus annectens]|uniref:synaptotagmin-like protein 2 isoform X2 n=1 Tax=Protopterus annectens TaxID=7888 RepID=UPI001CF9EB54|nr:synaptotagmin-like protein 2 isoform X2 [Protopterus annectens]